MSKKGKFDVPARIDGPSKTVWIEYSALAAEFKPLNLGMGFPDFPGAAHFTQALADVAVDPDCLLHQYTRGFGHPRLVKALATLYSQLISRTIDPMTEFLITDGAYEALYTTLHGHLHKGDEAILIEPFFDCYEPMVKAAEGVCRFISLKKNNGSNGCNGSNENPFNRCVEEDEDTTGDSSANWTLDRNELEGLFNEKTKLILVNTPHNPIGKVFSRDELQFIADLCKKWDVLCISDEVYEWMVYKPKEHIRMATLPDMWERTITIGSAGKSYSVTGWKIGWAYGPSNLLHNLRMVHQNCVYTCATPLQEALARGIENEIKILNTDQSFFRSLNKELERKRNFTYKFLAAAGFKPINPEGGYFVVADWSPFASKVNLDSETDEWLDYRFTKWMTKNIGFLAIPTSAFYTVNDKQLGQNYIRVCFIKKDENLRKCCEVLQNWSKTLK